jgi:hypothetical protein
LIFHIRSNVFHVPHCSVQFAFTIQTWENQKQRNMYFKNNELLTNLVLTWWYFDKLVQKVDC